MGAYSFYHFQRYIFSKFIIHQKTKMKEHCSNECLQFSRGGGGRREGALSRGNNTIQYFIHISQLY